MSAPQYVLKTMSLGEILDQAVQLTRAHFREFFTIGACIYGPFMVVNAVYTETAQQAAAAGRGAFGNPIALVLMMAGLVVFMPLSQAAIITAVSGHYLGRPVAFGEAIRSAVKKLVPLILTYMLLYLIVGVGIVCLVIPGLYLIFAFMLVSQVVVIENIAYMGALERSRRLMKGNIGTGFVLGLLVGIISFAAMSVVGFIPVKIISQVVQILISLGTFVFSASAFVTLYFSARCQHENFDLQMLAEQMQRNAAE